MPTSSDIKIQEVTAALRRVPECAILLEFARQKNCEIKMAEPGELGAEIPAVLSTTFRKTLDQWKMKYVTGGERQSEIFVNPDSSAREMETGVTHSLFRLFQRESTGLHEPLNIALVHAIALKRVMEGAATVFQIYAQVNLRGGRMPPQDVEWGELFDSYQASDEARAEDRRTLDAQKQHVMETVQLLPDRDSSLEVLESVFNRHGLRELREMTRLTVTGPGPRAWNYLPGLTPGQLMTRVLRHADPAVMREAREATRVLHAQRAHHYRAPQIRN